MTPIKRKRFWTIDVCRYCGVQAVYPFSCGHRCEDEMWTVPIVVKPAYPAAAEKVLPK